MYISVVGGCWSSSHLDKVGPTVAAPVQVLDAHLGLAPIVGIVVSVDEEILKIRWKMI
jgi:hypothetical protein